MTSAFKPSALVPALALALAACQSQPEATEAPAPAAPQVTASAPLCNGGKLEKYDDGKLAFNYSGEGGFASLKIDGDKVTGMSAPRVQTAPQWEIDKAKLPESTGPVENLLAQGFAYCTARGQTLNKTAAADIAGADVVKAAVRRAEVAFKK